jgi:acyl-CoA reductase-like NAD-dependent aldehyde dehydrogenase
MPSPRWQPGQSGNPSERPKILFEIRALARQHTEAALKTLAEIMGNQKAPASARVAAAAHLLDRGYGRPESRMDASLEPSTATQSVFSAMSKQEIERLLQLFDQAGFSFQQDGHEVDVSAH